MAFTTQKYLPSMLIMMNVDNSIDNAKYIDMCVLNSSHYDIALVCHKYLKDKHRYIKNNIWEYITKTDKGEDIWTIDTNNENIIYSIKTIICKAFTERSIYWSSNTHDNTYQDTEIISKKLLNISLKLKETKYISLLIKECKQFFIT